MTSAAKGMRWSETLSFPNRVTPVWSHSHWPWHFTAQPPESLEVSNLSLVYSGKLLYHTTVSTKPRHSFDMQMYREFLPSYSCEFLVPCFKKSEWNNGGVASLQDHGVREDFKPSLH